ncbi:MAG TPA: DNA-formamidopyrimidine glycosylase family protein [Vicinamibacterales bacterium]|nr:DNA-formamidopyrimidine glycosylase family protein [Vicinamibacterales bacterium]
MPELPDIELYLTALAPRVIDRAVERVRIASPFFVRTVDPPLASLEGRVVRALSRMGKRLVWHLDPDLFAVMHLMIAGRLRWRDRGAPIPGKVGLAALDFPGGTLLVTEAGSRRRASLHVVRGNAALAALDPGGADVFAMDSGAFAAVLRGANHTLKRSLTDPHLFSGIGNAYSDEILHAARLSPVKLTLALTDMEIERLYEATRQVLRTWTARLVEEAAGAFPEKVTAFRPGMAVHGRYGQPCPGCGAPVQRIVYARNEANYCAACQTGGRLLADRALSRLLRDDWPKTLEDLERRSPPGRKGR